MGIEIGPINFGNYNILTKMTHTKLLLFYSGYKKLTDVHTKLINQSFIVYNQITVFWNTLSWFFNCKMALYSINIAYNIVTT